MNYKIDGIYQCRNNWPEISVQTLHTYMHSIHYMAGSFTIFNNLIVIKTSKHIMDAIV